RPYAFASPNSTRIDSRTCRVTSAANPTADKKTTTSRLCIKICRTRGFKTRRPIGSILTYVIIAARAGRATPLQQLALTLKRQPKHSQDRDHDRPHPRPLLLPLRLRRHRLLARRRLLH